MVSECTKCGHDPAAVKDAPLQMLLAASMLVQRLKDLSGWTRRMAITARGSANAAYMDSANSIDGILNEFATDSKGSTVGVK